MSQIEIPEAEITDLCRRYGVRKLALFGSVLTSGSRIRAMWISSSNSGPRARGLFQARGH